MNEIIRVLQKVLPPDSFCPSLPREPDGFFTAQMIEQKWEYRDFPRMDQNTWLVIYDKIKDLYKPLTWARYPNGQCRGQVVVSPEGIRIMRELLHAYAS